MALATLKMTGSILLIEFDMDGGAWLAWPVSLTVVELVLILGVDWPDENRPVIKKNTTKRRIGF